MSRGREAIHLGFHHSTQLITSIITTKTTTRLIDGLCGSVHVSTQMLIKHFNISNPENTIILYGLIFTDL